MNMGNHQMNVDNHQMNAYQIFQEFTIPPSSDFWKYLLVVGIVMFIHARYFRKDITEISNENSSTEVLEKD